MRIAFKVTAQIGDEKIVVTNQAELIALIDKLCNVNHWLSDAPFQVIFDESPYDDDTPIQQSVSSTPSTRKGRSAARFGKRAIDYIVRVLKPLQDRSHEQKVPKEVVYEVACESGWSPKAESEKGKQQVFDLASGQFPHWVIAEDGYLSLTEEGKKHYAALMQLDSKQT